MIKYRTEYSQRHTPRSRIPSHLPPSYTPSFIHAWRDLETPDRIGWFDLYRKTGWFMLV